MKYVTTALAAGLLSAAPVTAQSIYVDFGPPGASVPPPTYGAAGPPGVWQLVTDPVTTGLIDTSGQPVPVTLSIAGSAVVEECDPTGPTGDDAALLDDRFRFLPWSAVLTISGLEAGAYRIHAYELVGGPACLQAFAMYVTIAGAIPSLDSVSAEWTGALAEGDTFTNQVAAAVSGQDLVIELDTIIALCCYLQISGLQLIKEEVVTAYCFGDGSGSACPCGNAGGAGEGCANSTGAGASLEESSGSTSVSTDVLRFTGHGLPPGQPALLFVGNDAVGGGGGAPFGDGLLCVGNNIQRLTVASATGAGDAFWGPGLAPLGGWGAGDVRRFQVWYRNPVGSPCGALFNLSHALEVDFLP